MLTFDPIILRLELFTKEIIKNWRKNFLWTVVHGNIMEYIVIITIIIPEGQQDGFGSKGICHQGRHLSLISGTHVVEGENKLLKVVL